MQRFPDSHGDAGASRGGTRGFAFILVALGLVLAVAAYGQVPPFRMTHYYPVPHQDRLNLLIEAEGFQTKPGGKILLKVAKIQTFRETGITNAEMIIETPDCLFERASLDASSTGPLVMNSGDGRLHIEGEGFYWRMTNSTLTISNKVLTTVRVDLSPQTMAAPTEGGANQLIRISADHAFFDRGGKVITYEGNVRIEESQMDLTCEVIAMHLLPDGAIDNIVADRQVTIRRKASGGRATGEHAVFTGTGGRQLVDLTGNPRWEDGPREGSGLVLSFDNINHTLRMDGQAYLKMPRPANGDPGFLPAPAAAPQNNAPAGEAGFVEFYSESMLFQFPPTNGPVQSVLAERKVLILDTNKNSRATSERAFYSAVTGRFELTGNAIWQADERLARGGLLGFDGDQKTFSARTNAYLKFPGVVPAGSAEATKAGARTNQFVEVLAEVYDFENNVLTFRGQVHAAFVEGGVILGALDCARLTVTFVGANQLQSLLAEQDVYARQLPFLDRRGNRMERELKTDRLKLLMGTNDLVAEIVAEHHVAGTQTETPAGTNKPVVMTLHTDMFSARFFPTTNQVEYAVADRDVRITRDEKTATGDRAVYTATNDVVRLLGNAVVTWPGFHSVAERISVERGTGRILESHPVHLELLVPDSRSKPAKQPDKPPQ